LNDDHAKVSKDLFDSILKMMKEYRSRVESSCLKQGLLAKDIKKEIKQVRIKQLDNTHDMAGLLYSNNLNQHLEDIGKLIGMRPAWNYTSLKSCLQFEEYKNNSHSLMTGRHKLYCKVPLHLL
jgi:hypothetical protein